MSNYDKSQEESFKPSEVLMMPFTHVGVKDEDELNHTNRPDDCITT